MAGRCSPTDSSKSNTRTMAQTLPQPLQRVALQQYIPSPSPELSAKSRPERSTFRGSTVSEKRDVELQPRVPLLVPAPTSSAPINVSTDPKQRQDGFDDRSSFHHRSVGLPLPTADENVSAIPESPTLQPIYTSNEDVPILEDEELVSATEPSHQRRRSELSTTTQDDEEIGDELRPHAVDKSAEAVPTVIEYLQPCERVYVTCSFASWGMKYPMYRKKDGKGFSATLYLTPGIHHVSFIVDNIPGRISPDMPTTVDLNNFLVNYIVVSPNHVSLSQREGSHRSSNALVYPAHSPLIPEEDLHPSDNEKPDQYNELDEPRKEDISAGDFRRIIPQALLDMELHEDDPRSKQASRVLQEGPAPPNLPPFLGRSTLNGSLPVKDDASVLAPPNHTVLNHLATSHVRNGVLATSVTTRYKKKVSAQFLRPSSS